MTVLFWVLRGNGTNEDGRVWRGAGARGGDASAALQRHGCLAPSMCMPHVAVFANPGTTHGIASGSTRERAIKGGAALRSKGERNAPARKMPCSTGYDNPIVRGSSENPTNSAFFVCTPSGLNEQGSC